MSESHEDKSSHPHTGVGQATNLPGDNDSDDDPTTNPHPCDRRDSAHLPLDEAILSRHSTRLYLPKPVPRPLLQHALELAEHSPSNSNTQAWRLFIVTGAALSRLKTALSAEASEGGGAPNVPGLPESLRPYRSELGKLVYGEGWGIPREDKEGRREAVLRNFEFFGAPAAAIVCITKELPGRAAFSVGMYVQTLVLALTERGVGSCVEVSVSGYPDVVRREVGIPADLEVLCGLAIGYEDAAAGVNRVRSGREGVESTTTWVEE